MTWNHITKSIITKAMKKEQLDRVNNDAEWQCIVTGTVQNLDFN